MGHSLAAFIVVIGILVFIHEFGHFIVARFCGVGVDVFSLGFGPKIVKRKVGRTEYCISAIPLGGYVKMVGESPGSEVAPQDESLSFTKKKLWQKSLIVAAGPVFNFLLAILIFFMLYQVFGVYLARPIVGEVMKDSPALAAGVKAGDIIREINQKKIESFEDIALVINTNDGKKLDMVIERQGEFIGVELTPMLSKGKNAYGEEIDRYIIGILRSDEIFQKRFNPLTAMQQALKDTYFIVELTLGSVVKMVQGKVSKDNVGGPIMIAHMAGESAKAGFDQFAWFIAIISVNLGILNLLPIPVLDGGHLLFFAIDAINGKEVDIRIKEKLMQVGVILLISLMVFAFYNDFMRFKDKFLNWFTQFI